MLLGLGGGAPDIIAVYSQVRSGVYAQTFGFVVGRYRNVTWVNG